MGVGRCEWHLAKTMADTYYLGLYCSLSLFTMTSLSVNICLFLCHSARLEYSLLCSVHHSLNLSSPALTAPPNTVTLQINIYQDHTSCQTHTASPQGHSTNMNSNAAYSMASLPGPGLACTRVMISARVWLQLPQQRLN